MFIDALRSPRFFFGEEISSILMAKILPVFFLLLLAAAAVSGAHHGHSSVADAALGWISGGGKSECRGTIAECLGAGEEFDLDSESSRRILAGRRYISYAALRRDSVPCSRRGASYYNCRPGAQANPYRRGCSAITRCRS